MEARTFLENFQVTDIEKDPLPIKVLRNAITKEEINGQAIYWGFEYLDSRSCPLSLIYRILQKLHEEVPVTDFLACAEENHATSLDDTDGAISPDADVRYAPLKLMQAIVKKIDEICLREREDVHDSVDGIIEAPDMLPNVHAVSYNNIKNSRRFMEDRMTVLPRMDRVFSLPAPMSYFAVFDGHNGSEAAAYGAAQLHQYLIKSMSESHDLFDCISNAFEHLDEVFVQKCKAGKIKSGSTAVISLLMADKVYVAWAGDSQAVLVKQNEVNNLVNPHKPERLDEVERIRSLGGEVLNLNGTYRVHGNLAVSRAIGDADEKPFIIATPDIKMQELDGSEEFMILACDGLWDEITPEAAAHIVRRQVVEDASNVSAVSSKLISEAKSRGSTDNITVIVVFFQPLESIKNLYESTITMESGVDNIMSKFENLGFNPAEKLIENVVDGKISPLKEINGHGKDGEPLVDFLSLGSSKESGGQPITDDTDQFGDDDDKDVEQLSDAEPDDEWQFEKPENLGMVSTTLDVQLNNATPEADDVFHSSHISNNQKEFTEPEFEIIQKPLAPVDSVPDVAPEMSNKLSESLNPFMMEAGTVTNGNETELDATFANSTPALSNGGNLFDGENIISETVRTEVDDDDDKPVVLSGTLDVLAEVQQQSPSPDPFGIQESVEQILAPTSAAASEIEEINFGAPSPHFDIQNTFATTQSDAAGDAGANPFELTSNSQSQIDFSDIGYQQVTPQSNVDEIGLGDNNPHISSGVLAEFLVGEQQSSDPFGVRDTFEQLPPQPTAGDIDIAFIAPNFDLHNAASTTEAVLDVNPFAEPPLLGADSQVDFNLGMPPPTNDVVLDDNITGIVTDFLTDQQQQSSQDPFGVQDNLDQSSPLQNATDVDLVLNASNNMDYGNFDLINHAPVKESVPDLATFGDELVSSHSQEKVNGGDEQFNLQEEVPEIIEKSEVIANLEAPIVESAASPQLLSEPERAASSASAVTSPEPEIEDRKSVELSEPVDPVPEIISEVSDKVSESLNPFILETVVNGNGNEHGTDEILGNASPALENNGFLLNGENTQPEIEVDEKPVVVRDLLPDFVADDQKVADRLGGENILQEPIEPPQAVVEEIVVAKSATPDLQAAPAIIEAVAEAAPLVETVKINGVEREINNKEKVSQPAAEKSKNVRNVETKTTAAAKTAKLPAKPDGVAPKTRAPITSAPARKSPTKPPTTTQAPPKPLMNGKSTAATKPTAPRTTATAPKPAAGRVGGAPASAAPRAAPTRIAPTAARPLLAKKDGAETKPALSRPQPASTLKSRPATAPSAAKPAPPKTMTATSPKRVPPTTSTARSTTASRPTTAAAKTTTAGAKAGDADGKSAALAKPRPRPLTATAPRAPPKTDSKPGVGVAERKVGTGTALKPAGASTTAPRTASRTLASRPVPTTTRTVTKTTTSATASKPASAKTAIKPVTVTSTAEPLQNNNSTN